MLEALLFGQGQGQDGIIDQSHTGQNSLTPKTYAILDAAKIANLSELLASSGLRYRCLFRGKAEMDCGMSRLGWFG